MAVSKKDIDLINELLDSLPVKHTEKNLQLVQRYGYLIGFLAHLASDDFYARSKIEQRIKQLKDTKK